jgi:two-component SAPR family response regulator
VIDSNNRRYSLLHSLKIEYDVAKYRQQAQHALAQFELAPLLQVFPMYGEFLADFDSEWCQMVRSDLAQLQIRMLEQASELRQGLGQFGQAINHLEQAVQLDPLRDTTWHHLERILRLSKDPRAESAARRIPWWLN